MSQSSDYSSTQSSEYSEYSVPTPKTPHKNCTRDDHVRIQTLFLHAGFTKDEIALQLNLTLNQVKYALRHQLTPQKKQHSGRYPLLGPTERKHLVDWVCANGKNRRTPWSQIPAILGWDCKVYAIQTAFKKEGFYRRTALKKPKLTPEQVQARLAWAREHINWTDEQWAQILWTDESWIQPGKHKKVKVTRRRGEALHRDCVEPKVQRKIGWMFWGSISGLYGKGPGLFWEKDWGTITSESYCQHIVPILAQYIDRTRLILMQDNAAGHAAKATLQHMREHNLIPIYWPANSPDLNPIETLWDKIKDYYIQEKYPDIHRSYPRLRAAVCEAWNSITEEDIQDLIKSMHNRCQAVIDAEGWHTKY
jgi:ketohexokinase/beta-glucosidase